jgi:hypothetical protein
MFVCFDVCFDAFATLLLALMLLLLALVMPIARRQLTTINLGSHAARATGGTAAKSEAN